jgi:hypothetical protein
MGIFRNLFNKKPNSKPSTDQKVDSEGEHAVIIRFSYLHQTMEPIYELEDKLVTAVSKNKVGEYDGHEIATDYNDAVLYLYGPNAEMLFKTIRPILKSADFLQGAIAKLRFGPPKDGVKEIEIKI